MLHRLLPGLGLCALTCSVTAADLPIVRIMIGPDGAVVERAGNLPKGDERVTGLPLGIEAERLSLTIDGLDTPPAIRLEMPPPVEIPPPDAAWLTRMATAQAAFDAAQPAIELADLRASLARSALALLAGGEMQFTSTQPVPAASIQAALLRFVDANLETAANERAAALRSRNAARTQIIALDEERERLRPQQAFTAALPLPGAGGRQVRLRYEVPGAAWAPVYRIEVTAGEATLVHEALIDVPRDQGWNQGRLELLTRQPGDDLLLRDLQVPVLELGDEVVAARRGGAKRAVGIGGGSKGSESAVDAASRSAKAGQAPDGSWPSGAWTLHATALNALVFLGAGYDHKTPNKYRRTVALAVGWLAARDTSSNDLAGQALVTMALAEAFAMANDPDLRKPAERALAALAARVVKQKELSTAIYRRGPMAGPEMLAWTTMATKCALAAGLSETVTTEVFATIDELLGELDGHADRDEARICRLVVDAFRGRREMDYAKAPPVSAWAERAPGWLREGRPELVYFATLGLFQHGGEAWKLWNSQVRDQLVQLTEVGERSGYLAATPYPLGGHAARAMVQLPLEVYYRYAQVGKGGDKGLFGLRGLNEIPELSPLPGLAQASLNWPLRIDAGPARLVDGQRVRVSLNRTKLPGRVGLRAAPADGPGAWRQLVTTNPHAVPLLGGEALVVVDGERIATAALPFTEPGAALTLDLGRDDRVQVTRREDRRDDEAWGRRTRTMTITYRVDAPPGLYPQIRLEEAMPVPQDGSIQFISLEPAIAGDAMDRRLVEDPVWRLDVDLRKPPSEARIAWQIRHPLTVRPQVRALSPMTENQAPQGLDDGATP